MRMELANVFFRPYEGFTDCRSCLDCHEIRPLFPAEILWRETIFGRKQWLPALPLREGSVRLPGRPDFGGRAGEVRVGFLHLWYADGSNIP